ncbi:MAG: YncE family protein [Methylocella sp.]
MQGNNSNGSRAAWVRMFAALCLVLAMGLGLLATLAAAAAFAYVANAGGTVSVIDTATNKVVATVPVGNNSSFGVAVTPDGKRAYVTSRNVTGQVSVITRRPTRW